MWICYKEEMNKDKVVNLSVIILCSSVALKSSRMIYNYVFMFCIQVSAFLETLWFNGFYSILIAALAVFLSLSFFSPSRLKTLAASLDKLTPHSCQQLLSWKCYRRPRESPGKIVGGTRVGVEGDYGCRVSVGLLSL